MKRSFDAMNERDPDASKAMLVDRNPAPNGVALVNARRVAKRDADTLVLLAMEIEKADTAVQANACNKLQIIVQQEQATKIIRELKENQDLHNAACNFVKVPGNIYYLYRRLTGQAYFSMLSPEEWTSCPHEFLGAYRLELDQSWTPFESISTVENENNTIHRLIKAGNGTMVNALEDSPMEQ